MTDINGALAHLTTAQAEIAAAKLALVSSPEPAVTVVRAGENLQAALDRGGLIGLEAATWEGTFTLPSNTRLTGRPGSKIHGTTGPALIVAPGTRDVSVTDLELASAHPEVCTIGENSERQKAVADMPTGIVLMRVHVPTHRGKRALAIHGQVNLHDCSAVDIWDPNGQDSQALYIGNTSVFPSMRGGRYSAGSEILLAGGDATWIPHVIPSDGLIDGVDFSRPLSWQTDGVARKVKTIVEIKNGQRITVHNCPMRGCWKDAQDGWAVTLTPALDGEPTTPPLQSGTVRDILFEDCPITDVAGGFSILGRHYQTFTPDATTGIVVYRVTLVASMKKFGGNRGNLALIQGEPGTILFDTVTAITDGPALVYYDSGDVLDPVTKVKRRGGKIGVLSMINSRGNLGEWGFMLNGNTNARNWPASVETFRVTGNAFGGGKMDLLGNTYQPQPFTE